MKLSDQVSPRHDRLGLFVDDDVSQGSEVRESLCLRSILKADEAYASAVKEYTIRRDIYGADAVAWTALKAGKATEAQAAMKESAQAGNPRRETFLSCRFDRAGVG